MIDLSSYAQGDGSDETAAIQAAIDAVPYGGVLYVPTAPLWYGYTYLVVAKPMTVRGDGWAMSQNSAGFGSANWQAVRGSVLRSMVTAPGPTLLLRQPSTNTLQFNLQDLAVVGPGAGQSTGVEYGGADGGVHDGGCSSHWHNVLIGNFYKDLALWSVEQCGFYDLRLRGCQYGLDILSTACNANWFVGLEVQSAGVVGVRFLEPGNGNTMLGGLFQGNLGDSIRLGGQRNRVLHCWFENLTATGFDVLLTNGHACLIAWNEDHKRPIRVEGPDSGVNYIIGNNANPDVGPELQIVSTVPGQTVVRDNSHFVLRDDTGRVVPYTMP